LSALRTSVAAGLATRLDVLLGRRMPVRRVG